VSSIFLLPIVACSSKVTSTLDPDLQAKVETVTDCIPPQMEKLKEVLELAKLWRQTDTNNPPDPSALNWSFDGTTITYTLTFASFTINGVIQFFDPGGGPVAGLTLSNASLSQAIDDAATELRNRTPASSSRPYIVADYTVSGASVSSAGGTSSPAGLTGFIAGSANQNELEELRSTEGTATATGGAPAVQDHVITTTGGKNCVFTFRIPSLLTDESPTQEYPLGTITWSLANQTDNITLAGNLVFDGTVTAVLNVTDVGSFRINIETLAVTSV